MCSVGYRTSVNTDVGYHVPLLFLCAVLRSQDESANSIEDHQKQKKVPPPGFGRSENPRFPEEEGVCVSGWGGGGARCLFVFMPVYVSPVAGIMFTGLPCLFLGP